MPKRTAVDRRARVLRPKSTASGPEAVHPPTWIKPQLTRLIDEAPTGKGWLHEIKYDGYRMHARIEGGNIQLLTRTGLDWSHRSVVFALGRKDHAFPAAADDYEYRTDARGVLRARPK